MSNIEKLFLIAVVLLLAGVYLRRQPDCGRTCKMFANGLTRKGVNLVLDLF